MAGQNNQSNALLDLSGLRQPKKPQTREEYAVERVQKGLVPKMVGWYSPSLLSKIAVRDGLSRSVGEIADKRQIMAATDPGSNSDLINRYDYRTPNTPEPLEGTFVHSDGSYYVDYVSDTGDGFGATFTMAYLLGAPAIAVPGVEKSLPQGDTLLLGGDQCYPQGSHDAYRERFVTPFEWAFGVEKPFRKMFAVPGNHDWYDGLNAFDALFCAARDKLSDGKGEKVGGWQCMQHRSYWALRMPYNWWIWGVDIQFSKYLDLAQENYFRAIAKQMGPDDRVLICIGEPTWMLGELEGKNDEINLPKIASIVSERRARIVAVIAGDWHHYSHYAQNDIGVHFITSGGGGAFLHPTHVLKPDISVDWPSVPEGEKATGVNAPIDPGTHAVPTRKLDIKLGPKAGPSGVVTNLRAAVDDAIGPLDGRTEQRPIATDGQPTAIKENSNKVYPSKGISRLLSFKNLAFPFYNLSAAFAIGVVYWLITWQFYPVAASENLLPLDLYDLRTVDQFWQAYSQVPFAVIQASISSIPFGVLMLGLYGGLFAYVPVASDNRLVRFLKKFAFATPHFLAHVAVMMALGLFFVRVNNGVFPFVADNIAWLWRTKADEKSVTGEVVRRALEPLSKPASSTTRRPADPVAVPPSTAPLPQATAPVPDDVNAPPDRIDIPMASGLSKLDMRRIRDGLGVVLYPLEMIFLGGIFGGLVLGLYWSIAGGFFRTHAEDAFAALRIRHYKNFLRLKFEPDQLTIYPIGVDRVPGDRDWVMPEKANGPAHRLTHPNNPALVPKAPIKVRLIEQPIVIARQRRS